MSKPLYVRILERLALDGTKPSDPEIAWLCERAVAYDIIASRLEAIEEALAEKGIHILDCSSDDDDEGGASIVIVSDEYD